MRWLRVRGGEASSPRPTPPASPGGEGGKRTRLSRTVSGCTPIAPTSETLGVRRGACHRFPMRFVMAIVLLTFPLHAALNMSTDFESGSARVLELDAAAQRVRIAPAGDPKRGMPNWWYVRIDGLDTNKPLTLEVAALDV